MEGPMGRVGGSILVVPVWGQSLKWHLLICCVLQWPVVTIRSSRPVALLLLISGIA